MFERLQEASKKPQPAATPGRKGSVGSSPASSPSSTAPPTSSPRWSDHVVLEETVKPLVNGDSHSARNSTAGGAGEQRNIHPESAIANGMGRQDTAAAAITQALEPNILEGEPPPPVKVPQHKKPSAPPRVESLRRSSEEGPLPAEPQQPEALKESRPVPSGAEGPGKEHSAEVVQELKLALSSARSSSSCSLDSGAGESRVFENNADRFEVAPYTECVLGASNKVSKTRSTDAVLLPEDAESHQHVNIGGLAAEELEWKAEDDGENERAKHSSSITFGRLGSTKPPLPSKLPVLDQISSRHNSGPIVNTEDVPHWPQQDYVGHNGISEPSSNSVLLYTLAAASGRSTMLLQQDNVCHDKYGGHSTLMNAAGETLAELENREHELFNVEAVINSRSYKGDPFGEINLDAQVDGSGVEFMTQEEADKLLSSCRQQEILSDEEAQEVRRLLVLRTPSPAPDTLSEEEGSRPASVVVVEEEGVSYHVLPDGHFFTEQPGLASDEEEDAEGCQFPAPPPRRSSRVKFSTDPIKVFSTHSVDDYDRRNDDVDPVSASAEYELEKRIEKMDVFPVELVKGPEGLGLSIIGMGVGADAGLEKLGIFVKTITENGAACKDNRIRVNDQIIEVDGKSLVGVTQAYAASVLRNTSGLVRFLIGRERDSTNSEIAQLIFQSIQADREREARLKGASQDAQGGLDSLASTPDDEVEELAPGAGFELSNDSSDSLSPDTDPDGIRLRFKETQYRLAVAEAEVRSLREKLELAEGERVDLGRLLEGAQSRLQEAEAMAAALREEATQQHQAALELQDRLRALEAKYGRAKRLLRELQQRGQEAAQREEFHLHQLQEKDHEYNALVKALKDRVILLENCLSETQKAAGLPVQLPYDNTMKLLTPQMKKRRPPPPAVPLSGWSFLIDVAPFFT